MSDFLDALPPRLPEPIDLDRAAGHTPSIFCREHYAALAERYSRNPHGLTCYAEENRRALKLAERTILQAVGAREQDTALIWCANGTEALNLALRGFDFTVQRGALAWDRGGHKALTATAKALGVPLRGFLLDDQGHIQFSPGEGGEGDPALAPSLAALSLVNNETGVLWDGDRTMLPTGCRVLLDACQALGKHPLPWERAPVDMMVLSSRKVGGPATGAALLYRRDLKLKGLLTGGGQQGGLLSGTVDVVSCLLFAAAAQEACKNSSSALEHVSALNRQLREGLLRLGKGAWPLFSPENASPYILYFAIPGYQGALVARLLAAHHHILVGAGSACNAESNETSPLLQAHGVPDDLARAALRISLAPETTTEEIEALLEALSAVIKEY